MAGADRLGGVLDDRDAALPGGRHDRGHLGHLAEEVDGDDRAGSLRDPFGHPGRVDVEGHRVHIHEDGRGADPGNDAGGREEGERRGDDFVPRPDALGHQCEEQRVGPRRNADPEAGPHVRRDGFLAGFDDRPENEALRVHDPGHGVVEFMPDGCVLCREIEQGYLSHAPKLNRPELTWHCTVPQS